MTSELAYVSGPLLLADISGYTSFLQNVATAHRDDSFRDGVPDAYAMMSDLLDGIVGQVVPPFTLAKLEGDAVFAFAADGDDVPRAAAMLDRIRGCYADFRRRVGSARQVWTCRCDACSKIDLLDLKFILHEGSFVLQSIAGGQELVGPAVVMAHRLLKSRAAELIGTGAYILITESAVDRFDVPPDGSLPLVETYEHYEPVHARVYPLRSLPSPARSPVRARRLRGARPARDTRLRAGAVESAAQ